MAKRDIVLIGGSAGSWAPLRQLMSELPRDFPGSVFITTHLPSTHESYLPEMLSRPDGLPISVAVDGRPIEPGRAYVAAAGRHLLLLGSTLRLGQGPRENMARPAIDPMFRSAALSVGARAVGVILSGLLNDGASGLFAIDRAGGTTVVQHPVDAHESSMPRAALQAVDADYVVKAGDLAQVLQHIVTLEAGPSHDAPPSLLLEVEVANGARLGSETFRRFAEPAPLTCPDCAGVLSEVVGEKPLRYRCQTGHAFTAEELAARNELLDEALRIALRVMEERVELVSRMAREAHEGGRAAVAELYEQRAAEYGRYAHTLREAAILSMRVAHAQEDSA